MTPQATDDGCRFLMKLASHLDPGELTAKRPPGRGSAPCRRRK